MRAHRLTEHQMGLAAIVVAALLWSTGGLFIKLLSQNAYAILCYRSGFAALIFGVWYGKKVFRFSGRTLIVVLFYIALVTAFVIATKLTTAANAIFLQYTAPIYLILLEPALFKFRQPRINWLTLIVCLAGMGLFFMEDLQIDNLKGILIALSSGVFLAGLMLSQRYNHPERHEAALFWGNVAVFLLFLPTALQSHAPSLSEWGMLSFLGLVQIGMGYMFFTYGLKRVYAIESSLLAMLEPVLNPIWVMIGYGEVPSLSAGIGGFIIIGILVVRTIVLERGRTKTPATL
ncbi:MAG: EamA family transporter [Lewinellaceae bacterium]|nr:EamA family transporter [Lewinellaceae bacterium]